VPTKKRAPRQVFDRPEKVSVVLTKENPGEFFEELDKLSKEANPCHYLQTVVTELHGIVRDKLNLPSDTQIPRVTTPLIVLPGETAADVLRAGDRTPGEHRGATQCILSALLERESEVLRAVGAMLLRAKLTRRAMEGGDANAAVYNALLFGQARRDLTMFELESDVWLGRKFPPGRRRGAYNPTRRLVNALCSHVGPSKPEILNYLTSMVDELGEWGDLNTLKLEDGSEYLIRTVEPETPGRITKGIVTADYRRGQEEKALSIPFTRLGRYISEFKAEKK
jgi:hypothetical protein